MINYDKIKNPSSKLLKLYFQVNIKNVCFFDIIYVYILCIGFIICQQ